MGFASALPILQPAILKRWTLIMWRASVLTIFPEMFPGPLGLSLAGKALTAGLWGLDTIDIRAHATDRHRSVADTPAGGIPLTQGGVEGLARGPGAVVLCGRFEGVDERLIAGRNLQEVSIGDYV